MNRIIKQFPRPISRNCKWSSTDRTIYCRVHSDDTKKPI